MSTDKKRARFKMNRVVLPGHPAPFGPRAGVSLPGQHPYLVCLQSTADGFPEHTPLVAAGKFGFA